MWKKQRVFTLRDGGSVWYTPSVLNYKQKTSIFFVPNYKQKRQIFIIVLKNYVFQRKIKCKVHLICSLFHFFNNQQPMKIIFTSSYKTYFKDNTKNYVTNYYVLVFLISVIFFLLIIWDGGSTKEE